MQAPVGARRPKIPATSATSLAVSSGLAAKGTRGSLLPPDVDSLSSAAKIQVLMRVRGEERKDHIESYLKAHDDALAAITADIDEMRNKTLSALEKRRDEMKKAIDRSFDNNSSMLSSRRDELVSKAKEQAAALREQLQQSVKEVEAHISSCVAAAAEHIETRQYPSVDGSDAVVKLLTSLTAYRANATELPFCEHAEPEATVFVKRSDHNPSASVSALRSAAEGENDASTTIDSSESASVDRTNMWTLAGVRTLILGKSQEGAIAAEVGAEGEGNGWLSKWF